MVKFYCTQISSEQIWMRSQWLWLVVIQWWGWKYVVVIFWREFVCQVEMDMIILCYLYLQGLSSILLLHNVALNYLLGIDWDVWYSFSFRIFVFYLSMLPPFFFFTIIVAIIAVCIVIGTSGILLFKILASLPLGLYFRAHFCRRILLFCPFQFILAQALDSELWVVIMWDISDQKFSKSACSYQSLFSLQIPDRGYPQSARTREKTVVSHWHLSGCLLLRKNVD